jgi:hypothetical protein
MLLCYIIERLEIKGVSCIMMKKWFGASLLVLVLALAGCSEEKAAPEKKPKEEQKEKKNTSEDMAKQQGEIIQNIKNNAVALDPKALEGDPKAYENKIIKATGKVSSKVEKGMGSNFKFTVGETDFKVFNFTPGSSFGEGSEITVYGNVKTGKDAKSGLSLINATYIE